MPIESNSGTTAIKVYNVLTTPGNGVETTAQSLVYGAGQPALWLDVSDSTCLEFSSSNRIKAIYDKTVTAKFNFWQQEDWRNNTPAQDNLDMSSLRLPSISLLDGFISTVGNPVHPLVSDAQIAAGDTHLQIANDDGEMTFFYVGSFTPARTQVTEGWLFNNPAALGAENYNPSATNHGGLKLVYDGSGQFHVVLMSSSGVQSTATWSNLQFPGTSYLLTVATSKNASGNQVIKIRLNGSDLLTYDPGSDSSSNYSLASMAMNSIGAHGYDAEGVTLAYPSGLGSLGEVIAYPAKLTDATIQSIESYLQTKWVRNSYPVSIDSISSQVGVHGQPFTALVSIPYGHTAQVALTSPLAGSNWTISAPTDGSYNWVLHGNMPPSVSAFDVLITAQDVSGTANASRTWTLYATLTGVLTSEQTLIYGLNPTVWLDPSDATTLSVDSNTGRLSYIFEKRNTSGFTVSSSETPVRDLTSFKVPGIAFAKTTESSSGHNFSVTLDKNTRPDVFGIDISDFQQGYTVLDEQLGNGIPVTAVDGSYTIFMVLRANGKVGGETHADIQLGNDFPQFAGNLFTPRWGVMVDQLGTAAGYAYQSDASDTSKAAPITLPPAPGSTSGGSTSPFYSFQQDYQRSVGEMLATLGAVVTWRFNAAGSTTPPPDESPTPMGGTHAGLMSHGDAMYPEVTFLLPFDTSTTAGDGNVVFHDYSPQHWTLPEDVPGVAVVKNQGSDLLFDQPTVSINSLTQAPGAIALPQSATAYVLSEGEATIEFWVKGSPNATYPNPTIYAHALLQPLNGSMQGIRLMGADPDHGGKTTVYVDTYSTTTPVIVAYKSVFDGSWTHVALQYDGNDLTLVINFVQVGVPVTVGVITDAGTLAQGFIGGDPVNQINYGRFSVANFRWTRDIRYPVNEQTGAPADEPWARGVLPPPTQVPPEIWINGVQQDTQWDMGAASNWFTTLQRFTRIFGAHAPGSIGEVIATPSYLSDATKSTVENHLMAKWFQTVGNPPTITPPDPDHQYVSRAYSGTVTITNGANTTVTASISASAGSNWTIAFVSGITWRITGTMPASAQSLTLTITGRQDGASTTTPFQIQAVALPLAPIIETLAPNAAPINSAYTGKVVILNVSGHGSDTGVSVSATAGSGWAIIPDPDHAANTYQVTGTMPGVLASFPLTITAEDISSDGLVAATASRTFILQATSDANILPTNYPLDLTGMLASNLIRGEEQTLTPDNGPHNQFLVPILSPFYYRGFVLQYEDNGIWVQAHQDLDYRATCELTRLSQACAFPIYTGIAILNLKIKGTVRLQYQTLGGNFVIDRQKIFEALTDRIVNQKEVDWSHVVNRPAFYPVAAHKHAADDDLVGAAPLVAAIGAVKTAYVGNSQTGDLAGMGQHIADHNNPHHVNKGQVGLGYVNNYPVATDTQAQDANNSTTYLTPRGAAKAAVAGIPHATSTVAGIAALNQGNALGDDQNSTDALTAAGLLALINSPTENVIQTAFSSGDSGVQVTPYPMQFPLYWQGQQHLNISSFISAVETAVGVEALQFNQIDGVFYFPRGVAVPSLTTYSSDNSTGTRPGTTEDPMSMPTNVPTF